MRVEGGLLNTEIIERIRNGEASGQSAKDFGLKRFIEETASIWNDARDYWRKFRRKRENISSDDPGTTVTRNLWMVPLLTLLDYNPVFVKKAEEVSGRLFPFSHRADESPESPPVHIVGFRQDLDQRPQRLKLSPQATVQEYLNLTDHLWGVVTNGLCFRLVRTSNKLTRHSYLEFDLEHIFESEDFPAFLLFFRMAHRSRLPKDPATAHECWLEKYHRESLEQGARIRDRLRDSVEKALKILGNGFLSHPENQELREKIARGEITPSYFYRELLQLIYRLLFIMVAEERDLLQPEDLKLREIYENYYGLSRLRAMSAEPEVLNPGFHDLWEGIKRLFYLLSTKDGEKLGLTVLNGGLFQWGNFFFKDYKLSNADFLKALNHLSYFEQDGRKSRVNYAALDVEELGSVYESLLDYQPVFVEENLYEEEVKV